MEKLFDKTWNVLKYPLYGMCLFKTIRWVIQNFEPIHYVYFIYLLAMISWFIWLKKRG